MHRSSLVPLLASLWLFGGCKQEASPAGPQIIEAGLGIAHRLEVGMTLSQIADRNDDFILDRFWKPDTWPWEKLFNKPRSYHAAVPSLGANISDLDEEKAVTMINFEVASLPETILRSGPNALTFRRGENVSRAQVIQIFGEARHRLNDMKPVPALINRGESVAITNEVSEHLYFSAHGVFFVFRNGALETLTIVKKFGGTNSTSPP